MLSLNCSPLSTSYLLALACSTVSDNYQYPSLLTVTAALPSATPPPTPPTPTPPPPKIHLLESSKLELTGLYLRCYSHILKC